jgi:hypothetical protein
VNLGCFAVEVETADAELGFCMVISSLLNSFTDRRNLLSLLSALSSRCHFRSWIGD